MNRFFCILLCALFLCSCSAGSADSDPLAYVRMPMTVTAHIACEEGGGRVVITFTDATHYAVRYTEPAVMNGITYERDGEDAFLSFGESRIPVTEGEVCLGSLAAARLLIPEGSARTYDAPDTATGENVRICKYHTDTLTAVHYLTDSGLPTRVEGEADGFPVTFTELVFDYN